MIGPGAPKSDDGRGVQRLLPLERVDAVLALVVADERDPVRLAVVQHDRRPVAAERVGVLLQLAVLQVERPDVVDVAVLARPPARAARSGSVAVDENTMRVVVDELRRRFVVRAEGELRLLLGVEIEPEQLLVAADARVVDDELAVGRVGRRRSRRSRRSVRLVICLGVEIDREDVADRRCAAPANAIVRPSGEKAGDSGSSTVFIGDALLRSSASARSGRSASAPSRCARSRRAGRPSATTTSTASSLTARPAATMWSKPMSLSKPLRQVADDRAVLRREQDDVELPILAVDGDRGDQIARRRRRDRQRLGEVRLLLVRRRDRGRSRPAAPCRGTA